MRIIFYYYYYLDVRCQMSDVTRALGGGGSSWIAVCGFTFFFLSFSGGEATQLDGNTTTIRFPPPPPPPSGTTICHDPSNNSLKSEFFFFFFLLLFSSSSSFFFFCELWKIYNRFSTPLISLIQYLI